MPGQMLKFVSMDLQFQFDTCMYCTIWPSTHLLQLPLPSPCPSVLPPQICQGDTGATQGQVQAEGVPQQPQRPVEGEVGG